MNRICAVLITGIFLWTSCGKKTVVEEEIVNEPAQFELLTQEHTGLNFVNKQTQSTEFNIFNYMYFYNGGGIGAGDFNNDGLTDLYFTSNMESNKLFLNLGEMKFEEVTEIAGVAGQEGWATGVSVIDINDDGLLDIYVGQVGKYEILTGKNQLYINKGVENGVPVFEDQAEEYGLDLVGFSTQASFFDYDLDGDLDMFQMNHSLHHNGTFGPRKNFMDKTHPLSGDRLFQNQDGKFVEVTQESGINSTAVGYGLGIVTGDVNNDGWPDIYIGNDFHENDYLYINQGDGTFRDVSAEQLMHTSRFSMGVDMGDINNDGNEDIISLDMLPSDPVILKSSLGEDSYSIFHFKLGYGYNHQYARNNLQLNNGDNTFSEIGLFSDVAATDWSWASLFVDFDQDGYKDLFISNGIPRRMNDIDYVNFRRGDEDVKWKTNTNYMDESDMSIVEKMPQIRLKNKFFGNNGDLTFSDFENRITNDQPTYSNGAVYSDLDNDGDLDIIVNNIDSEPYIYQNLNQSGENSNSLIIDLIGPEGNRNAIGTRVLVFKGEEMLNHFYFPVRGYQSSVIESLNMGVGNTESIDSMLVIWPDQTYSLLEKKFNTPIQLSWTDGLPKFDFPTQSSESGSFTEVAEELNLAHKHDENPFVEFDREILIPHMVSREGPALAVGDINGDGLEDVFFGSSKSKKSMIYVQNTDGTFSPGENESIESDLQSEHVDAEFVDLDNDGDLDLVVATGGNEYWGNSEFLLQVFYLNDGNGKFGPSQPLPESYMTAASVSTADYNGDGLVDLFFGGRAVPKNYGVVPESRLYKNLGNGKFEEVTANLNSDLSKAGFVKNSTWTDIDQDGDPDLILALEWGPITIYENEGDSFSKAEISDDKGWWNFALPIDLDNDGDLDILSGNTGKNSKLKPSTEEPVRLYVKDFDGNGSLDQILTYYLDGREIPFANFMELTKQLNSIKKEFLYSKDLAKASIEEIFGKDALEEAEVLTINTLESVYFENTGDMNFKKMTLPVEAQLSPIQSAFPMENGILLGGNYYDCNIEMGRYDATYGQVLNRLSDGTIKIDPIGNIRIKGQVKGIKAIEIGGETHYILVRNNDTPIILKDG